MNNARRNKNPSNRRNENRSTEQVKLGTLMHIVEKQPVIALVSQDIPYPNSPVLLNDKVIGKIDEVLGTLEKAYASVTLDKDIAIEPETMFYGYKDKFIMKKRFLPRDDVEKKKEENDKSQKRQSSGNRYDKKSYGDRKGSSRSYNDQDRGNKRSYNDQDRGNKRSYSDRNENKRFKK